MAAGGLECRRPYQIAVEIQDYFRRAELLNLKELRRKRPDWTDRLPHSFEPPSFATRDLVQKHWSYRVPAPLRELYSEWLTRRMYRRYLEQIERDELDEVCELEVDSPEATKAVYDKHQHRREALLDIMFMKHRARLERLARRWDVDVPILVHRGQANQPAFAQVRRAIRNERWLFMERCAKVLIPILSLLVAILALLNARG